MCRRWCTSGHAAIPRHLTNVGKMAEKPHVCLVATPPAAQRGPSPLVGRSACRTTQDRCTTWRPTGLGMRGALCRISYDGRLAAWRGPAPVVLFSPTTGVSSPLEEEENERPRGRLGKRYRPSRAAEDALAAEGHHLPSQQLETKSLPYERGAISRVSRGNSNAKACSIAQGRAGFPSPCALSLCLASVIQIAAVPQLSSARARTKTEPPGGGRRRWCGSPRQ